MPHIIPNRFERPCHYCGAIVKPNAGFVAAAGNYPRIKHGRVISATRWLTFCAQHHPNTLPDLDLEEENDLMIADDLDKQTRIQQAIAAVGYQPGALPDSVPLTGTRRTGIRNFCRAHGISGAVDMRMSADERRRVYNAADPAAEAARIMAYHAQPPAPQPTPQPATQPAPTLPLEPTQPKPAPQPMPTTETIKDNAAMPVTTPQPAPAVADAVQTLLAALAAQQQQQPAGLTAADVIALIEKHNNTPRLVRVEITGPQPRELPEAPRHRVFERVLKAVAAGLNVYLVGPAGSGKTTLCEQVAEALDIPFFFNGAIASEYKLTGFIDAQGRFVSTAFRRAYESGGLYLFDEVDASLPQALLAFNAALANGYADFPDGMIKRHPHFRCIAAANTFGHGADRVYVGRNQLDAASLDRFVQIEMDYDPDLERLLAGNDDWTSYVQRVRAAVQSLKLRFVVSPRASINGAIMLAAGVDRADVENAVIWRGMDSDTRAKVSAALK